MVVSLTLTQHGLGKVRKLLSPSRWERARTKALTAASNELRQYLEAHSRVDTGAYEGGWRVDRSQRDKKTVFNVVAHALFVTGDYQPSVHHPRGESGEFFMRSVKSRFLPQARRTMKKTMFDYIQRGR